MSVAHPIGNRVGSPTCSPQELLVAAGVGVAGGVYAFTPAIEEGLLGRYP